MTHKLEISFTSLWGNVGIFYAKQAPYNGLVYLGRVLESSSGENGVEILKNKKDDFKVLIKR